MITLLYYEFIREDKGSPILDFLNRLLSSNYIIDSCGSGKLK